MRHDELWFKPKGDLIVTDRLVQPDRVARDQAEAVEREAKLRFDRKSLLVVVDPLGHCKTSRLHIGPGPFGVVLAGPLIAVVRLVEAAPAGQRDSEHVLRAGEFGSIRKACR